MRNINSKHRLLVNKKLELEISILKVDLVKREAELELIKEQIRHKQFTRKVMKFTTTITGFSLLTTVLVHFGIIPKS